MDKAAGEPLDSKARQTIANTIWICGPPTKDAERHSAEEGAFFAHYEEASSSAHDLCSSLNFRHQDLLDIILIVRKDPDKPHGIIKEAVEDHLIGLIRQQHLDQSKIQVPEAAKHMINLSLQLSLLIRSDKFPGEVFHGQQEHFYPWNEYSLKEFLKRRFVRHITTDNSTSLSDINIRNITRIGGFSIVWTNNLFEHLHIDHEERLLYVFHHATFLKREQRSSTNPFPKGFVEETLKTLSLLFQQSDKKTRSWFKKESRKSEPSITLDPEARKCTALVDRDIKQFKFWKKHLVELKKEYDNSQPKSWKQWWSDDRRPADWYAFWVAIIVVVLTLFFGLIQSIEGAIQVYKAYHPS